MTISVTDAATGPYYPNGVTVEFPFDFSVDDGSEVRVLLIGADGSEETINPARYSVAIAADQEGGTVSISPPLPDDGRPLWLALDPTFEQQILFEDEGAFNADVLNPVADQSARRSVWLRDRVGRALQVPFGESVPALPPAAFRRGGLVVGFNQSTGEMELQASGSFKGDPGGDAAQVGYALQVSALNIDVSRIKRIQTTGYSAHGDGGAAAYALFSVTGVMPMHPGFLLSNSGLAVWVIDQPSVAAEAVGAKGDWNGVSGTNDVAALRAALQLLAAKVVKEVTLRSGADYWLGDYTGLAQTSVFGPPLTSGLTGHLAGNGARFVVRGGNTSTQDVFLIQRVSDFTVSGLRYKDLSGHNNSNTNPKGFRAFTLYGGGGIPGLGGGPCTNVTLRDNECEGMLSWITVLTNDPNASYRVAGLRLEGRNVIRSTYYAITCQEDGDDIRGTFAAFNVRRGAIVYGCRTHVVSVTCSHDGTVLGSNGFIDVKRYVRDTYDLDYTVQFSGTVVNYTPARLEHQNDDGAAARIDRVKLSLFFPAGTSPGTASPAVTFNAMTAAGAVLNTPLNEEALSGATVSPVTTRQHFGNVDITIDCTDFGSQPFVFSTVVPLDPGNVRLAVPLGFSAESIKMPGFMINGAFLVEASGNLTGKAFSVPLYAFHGFRVAVEMEIYAQDGQSLSGKQHFSRHVAHGYVGADGTTGSIGTVVEAFTGSASTGSDLTVVVANGWGYKDRFMLNVTSAADYVGAGSYARVRAKVVCRRAV